MMNRKSARYSLLLISLLWPLLHTTPCSSQGHVVLDGTLGSSGPLSGPNFNITSGLGKTVGNNLFQSFSQFDLVNGDVATFSGPANIHNVLARVTGGSLSSIDGTIESSIQGANLFFINPFGVLFESNAKINVSGSFAVTTASYIKLADGGRFDAVNPGDSILTAAPVSAFGFSGTPGSISFAANQGTLGVNAGQSFSVIGGDIMINGATIQAPGGRVNLVSVKSAGELALDVTDFTALPNTTAFSSLGQITVQNQSVINASADGGGQVVIRGGTLMVQNSLIEANTLGAFDGKGIDINVTGNLVVNGGAISTDTSGSGDGGSLNITAGAITLNAEGSTTLFGILSDDVSGSGNGGNVNIATPTLDILNGARVSAATGGVGNGGNVTVSANRIDIDAQNAQGPEAPLTGFAVSSQSMDAGGGNAGSIVIRPLSGALSLQVVNGGLISANTQGGGAGGGIDIIADSILLDGQGASIGTGIAATTFSTGAAGEITIHQTRTLTMLNGATIDAETHGSGAGGDIDIAAKTIDMESSSAISAGTIGHGPGGGITLTAKTIHVDGNNTQVTAGNDDGFDGDAPAGDIIIRTGSLDVLNGAAVSALVKAGNGGNISITAHSSIDVLNAGITASAPKGDGGNVTIIAGDFQSVDSQITANAAQIGGNISLSVLSTISLENSPITAIAGATSPNARMSASIMGGNIFIGPPLLLFDAAFTGSADPQSTINASAKGMGSVGGNVTFARNFTYVNVLHSGDFENGTLKIGGPILDLTGIVAPLPGSLLDVEAELQPYCGMNLAGDVSSFLVRGSGGVVLEPFGVSPSFGWPVFDDKRR